MITITAPAVNTRDCCSQARLGVATNKAPPTAEICQALACSDEAVSPQRKAGVQQILESNKGKENVIATSVITLGVIPSKLDAKKPGAAKQYLGMFDAIHFVEVEINRNILLRACEIREF